MTSTTAMPTFRVVDDTSGGAGREAIVLGGDAAGAWARVTLRGANVARWAVRDEAAGGAPRELIDGPPFDDSLEFDPFGCGTPVLAPFPNRIFHGWFFWEGRRVQLEPDPRLGHAIHGVVAPLTWERVALHEGDDCAWVALWCSYRPVRHKGAWPWAFDIQLTTKLSARELELRLVLTNTGRKSMPAGLGLHPYLRLPFVPGTERGDHTLTLPATERWELDGGGVPTGRRYQLEGNDDWRAGKSLGAEVALDDVFGALERREDGTTVARLECARDGSAIEVVGGPTAREFTVYTPGAPRPAIAIEPGTCATDAFNLAARGIDGGMRVLAPSDALTVQVTLRYSPAVPRAADSR